jgi:hypothetical protein
MARQKTGEAYETLSCRIRRGFNERIAERAALDGVRSRDVVNEALRLYLDNVQSAPSNTSLPRLQQINDRATELHRLIRAFVHDSRKALRSTESENDAVTLDSTSVTLDFDTSKYHLGKLCPAQHVYPGTRETLRDHKGSCVECERDRKRRARAQKKATSLVLT